MVTFTLDRSRTEGISRTGPILALSIGLFLLAGAGAGWSLDSGVAAAASTVPDHLGWALWFDGVDDLVNLGNSSLLNATSAYTIEAWVLCENPDTQAYVVSRYNGGMTGSYQLNIDSSNPGPVAPLFSCESPFAYAKASSPLVRNTWTHMAGVFSSGVVRLYVNGSQAAVASGAGTKLTTVRTLIGAAFWSGEVDQSWAGLIDEVRYWSVARDAGDIQSTMHVRLTGTEPGLVGYWDFEDGSGQIAADRCPNGLHGTLGMDSNPASDDPQWYFVRVPASVSVGWDAYR